MEELTIEQIQQFLNNSHWKNDEFNLRFFDNTIFINEDEIISKYQVNLDGKKFIIVLTETKPNLKMEIDFIDSHILMVTYRNEQEILKNITVINIC